MGDRISGNQARNIFDSFHSTARISSHAFNIVGTLKFYATYGGYRNQPCNFFQLRSETVTIIFLVLLSYHVDCSIFSIDNISECKDLIKYSYKQLSLWPLFFRFEYTRTRIHIILDRIVYVEYRIVTFQRCPRQQMGKKYTHTNTHQATVSTEHMDARTLHTLQNMRFWMVTEAREE